MEHKFLFSDLVLFFRIIKKDIGIELPDYISKIESHDVKSITRCSKPISDGKDNLQYICKLIPKVKCFENSYFVRTVQNWNKLPCHLRKIKSIEEFKANLKEHMWLILGLKPD